MQTGTPSMSSVKIEKLLLAILEWLFTGKERPSTVDVVGLKIMLALMPKSSGALKGFEIISWYDGWIDGRDTCIKGKPSSEPVGQTSRRDLLELTWTGSFFQMH